MSLRTRYRLTAWLGLIAMLLIVIAPIVSQLSVAPRIDDAATAALCSGTPPSAPTAHAAHRADPLAACGYCDLLANHPAMPAAPAPMLFLVVLIAATIAPTLCTRFMPLGAFPSGRPRGPPAVRTR
ncbi:MAG TPA: DUF2946 domain-containing protein [Paraburkholderia sp.]|jgi:hypothetical protein|nr:DUF2946 domain-containing protein [Paraburkholderia sp.]